MKDCKRRINYIKEKRDPVGCCNICGKKSNLTWDHVPPKTVTNGYSVNVNRLFNGLPENRNCEAVYKKGIKYRSICSDCNNALLGENDKYYSKFAGDIFNAINEAKTKPWITTKISKVCKAVLGYFLAAKNSYDEYCVIDKTIRDYLLGKIDKPKCKLFYWIYPYDTVNVARDISLVNVHGGYIPKGTISIMACCPVGFLLTDENGSLPGSVDLISLITDDEEQEIKLLIDVQSAFYTGTRKLKHYLWPCNIGDDEYSVGAVLVGKYGREDSRFATRRR